MSNVDFGTNSAAVQKKRVYYEGSNAIYEGMALCYNYDTTSNILGWDKANGVKGSTTADGNQNEGKFLRVEEPSVANSPFFAGVVAGPDKGGQTGPCWVNIYIPNGAIVPVWTDKSITAKDKMYLEPGENTLVNDVQGIYVGMSLETKDRSSTAGIVLAKLDGVDTAGAVQVVDANSRTTVQLPTAAIWNNFDLEELRRNPFAGALLDVDFKRHSDMPDKTFSDAAGTILQPENAIGELALFETTDNQGNEVAWSIPVTVSGGAKWAIEFRIKASVTGDNLGGWCCGLGLNSGAFAGDQIADGATLIDGGFVGFQSKEADGDKIDLVYDDCLLYTSPSPRD